MDRYDGLRGLDVSSRPAKRITFRLIDDRGHYHLYSDPEGELITDQATKQPIVIRYLEIGSGCRYVEDTSPKPKDPAAPV